MASSRLIGQATPRPWAAVMAVRSESPESSRSARIGSELRVARPTSGEVNQIAEEVDQTLRCRGSERLSLQGHPAQLAAQQPASAGHLGRMPPD